MTKSATHIEGYRAAWDAVADYRAAWKATLTPLNQAASHAAWAKYEIAHDYAKATASLAIEAGTVLHETGLTPRQLADQRAALLEALEALKSAYCAVTDWADPEVVIKVRAAIAKGESK